MSESAFKLAEVVKIVYAEKETEDVVSFMDGADRGMIKFLVGRNAAGKALRPLNLFELSFS